MFWEERIGHWTTECRSHSRGQINYDYSSNSDYGASAPRKRLQQWATNATWAQTVAETHFESWKDRFESWGVPFKFPSGRFITQNNNFWIRDQFFSIRNSIFESRRDSLGKNTYYESQSIYFVKWEKEIGIGRRSYANAQFLAGPGSSFHYGSWRHFITRQANSQGSDSVLQKF